MSYQDVKALINSVNLDNLVSGVAMSKKEGVDMASERRRVIIGYNDDGSPIRKEVSGKSQDEVNERIVQAYVDSGLIWRFINIPNQQIISTNKSIECGTILNDYMQRWLERKRKLKPTTRVNYTKYIKYISSHLGHKDLCSITSDDVQSMLDKHKHLSKKTLKEMLNVLKQIMKYAKNDELIKKNPCDSLDIEIPSDKVTEREALPIEQYKDIIRHLKDLDMQDRWYMGLLIYTGMRKGEALGLKWDDIDFDTNYIYINQSVAYPQQNQPIIQKPKTKAGVRKIPLDENLKELIRGGKSKGYIIGGENPLTQSAFTAMMKRIRKTIDLHGASAHVLRHSYLTFAVGVSNDFKTIQGISGHADVNTLLNRYAHVQGEKVKSLSDRIHNVLTI